MTKRGEENLESNSRGGRKFTSSLPVSPFQLHPSFPTPWMSHQSVPWRSAGMNGFKLATFLSNTLFFLPQTTGTWEETNLLCFQIHSLRDTFQKALLLQQQCSFHRPCVSVPPEKKHPQRVLEAMAPSEGSLAAVCSNSWGLVPHYPKTAS